jgi:Acyltransferase family
MHHSTPARFGFLDGLRGWGAVFVLLFHVLCDRLPPYPPIAEMLSLFVPFNGKFAVYVFFIVSGFSLTIDYLIRGNPVSLAKMAVGRYLRLAVPVFFACLVVHLAMLAGLIAAPSERLPIFQQMIRFEPTAAHLFRFSLFDVFFNYRHADTYADTYIGPLWTMSYELVGSFVVMATVLALRPAPMRPLIPCWRVRSFAVHAAVRNLRAVPARATDRRCFRQRLAGSPAGARALPYLVGKRSPLAFSQRCLAVEPWRRRHRGGLDLRSASADVSRKPALPAFRENLLPALFDARRRDVDRRRAADSQRRPDYRIAPRDRSARRPSFFRRSLCLSAAKPPGIWVARRTGDLVTSTSQDGRTEMNARVRYCIGLDRLPGAHAGWHRCGRVGSRDRQPSKDRQRLPASACRTAIAF